MKFLSTLFIAVTLMAVPAYAQDCVALDKDPNDGKASPEAVACLRERIAAKKKALLEERAQIEAQIREAERNAPKLPAE